MLVDSISKQFNAFAKGFFSVCGGPALELFKPQELELLICGSPTLDFHALEDAALLEDGSETALNVLFAVCFCCPDGPFTADTSKAIRLFACYGRCCILSTWSRRKNSYFFAPEATARPLKVLAPWFLSSRVMGQTVSDCRRGGLLCFFPWFLSSF